MDRLVLQELTERPGTTGEVAELTLEEIRQLNFGTPEDPQQIMLLEELLVQLDSKKVEQLKVVLR